MFKHDSLYQNHVVKIKIDIKMTSSWEESNNIKFSVTDAGLVNDHISKRASSKTMWDESWFINIKKNQLWTDTSTVVSQNTNINAFLLVSRHYAIISALSRLKFLDNDNHISNKYSIIAMVTGYLFVFQRSSWRRMKLFRRSNYDEIRRNRWTTIADNVTKLSTAMCLAPFPSKKRERNVVI